MASFSPRPQRLSVPIKRTSEIDATTESLNATMEMDVRSCLGGKGISRNAEAPRAQLGRRPHPKFPSPLSCQPRLLAVQVNHGNIVGRGTESEKFEHAAKISTVSSAEKLDANSLAFLCVSWVA